MPRMYCLLRLQACREVRSAPHSASSISEACELLVLLLRDTATRPDADGEPIVSGSKEDSTVAAVAFTIGRLAGSLKLRTKMAKDGVLNHLGRLRRAAQPGCLAGLAVSKTQDIFLNLRLPVDGR